MAGLDSSTAIMVMIGICVVIMMLLLLIRPIKAVFRALIRSCVGMALVFVINFFASQFGVAVGINLFTAVFVGILGAPGLVTLYIVSFFA